MVAYRRNFVAGGTYFFTVTLRDRRARFLVEHVDDLRRAFAQTRARKPFVIEAMVVLPDHLHAIWRLPEHDTDYPGRWKSIKSLFSQELDRQGIDVGKRHDGSASIWQRRYWEHTIRDEQDWLHHIDYIHFNPVKHGCVQRVQDWPFSSFCPAWLVAFELGWRECCGSEFRRTVASSLDEIEVSKTNPLQLPMRAC